MKIKYEHKTSSVFKEVFPIFGKELGINEMWLVLKDRGGWGLGRCSPITWNGSVMEPLN